MKTTTIREPEHDYPIDENNEDELYEDEDEDVNFKPRMKHDITLKHVSNVFACMPEWDSLDDCDIVENFK